MNAKALGNRIRDARTKAGLTQAQLAAEVGLTTIQTIGSYEAGRQLPPLARLARIAEVTGLPIEFFTSESSDPARSEVDALLLQQQRTIQRFIEEQRKRGTGELASDIEDFARIPLVGEVCAGDGIFAEENIEEYILVPRHDIPSGVNPFYVRVNGECLREGWGIHDGDLVCVGPGLEAENGDLVVAIVNDAAHLKRLKKAGDHIFLLSDDDELELTPADSAGTMRSLTATTSRSSVRVLLTRPGSGCKHIPHSAAALLYGHCRRYCAVASVGGQPL